MAHVLNAFEKSVFLSQVHPEVADEIARLDGQPDDVSVPSPLTFPNAGGAFKWPDGTYTLVWRDASRKWWFIDVTDKFATVTNKPAFVPTDAGFLHNVAQEIAELIEALKHLPQHLPSANQFTGIVVAIAVIALINYLPRIRS